MVMPRASVWGIRLAFAALLLRAVLPAGFMPAAAAHGVVVVICTGHGAIAGAATPKGAPPADAGHDCPFAGLSAPTHLPMTPAGIPSEPAHSSVPLSARVPDGTVPALAAPPPSATGPPAAL